MVRLSEKVEQIVYIRRIFQMTIVDILGINARNCPDEVALVEINPEEKEVRGKKNLGEK